MTDSIKSPLKVPSVPVVPGQAPRGMIPAEAAIMDLWLSTHLTDYDSVTFNVRVGKGIDPGPNVPDFARQQAIANSQRRIDAVLQKGVLSTIVEVKVRGSLWAIGQLQGYSVLWSLSNPGPPPLLLMLCASIDPDTALVYNHLGIPFVVVGA